MEKSNEGGGKGDDSFPGVALDSTITSRMGIDVPFPRLSASGDATPVGSPGSPFRSNPKGPMFNVDLSSLTLQSEQATGSSPNVSNDKFEFEGHEITSGPTQLQVGSEQVIASMDDIEKLDGIGSGIHGSVWKIRLKDQPDSKLMAMKAIDLGKASDEAGCKQIITELDVLKMASECPYIVDFYGSFYHECIICIIMEHRDLGSLSQVLKSPGVTEFPEQIVQQVASSTLLGLQFLKRRLKVIHRDIKPSNILMGSDGCIKVCDFSVSGKLVESVAKTYTGTVYYMAPERIQPSRGKGYDQRSDVWSLGITIAEISLGKYPYPLEEKLIAMMQVIVRGPTPVESEAFKAKGFSAAFTSFCTKCLEKNVKDRCYVSELLKHEFITSNAINPRVVIKWLESVQVIPTSS
eukprot:m.8727 g.8727  ORF g.8727 m.8727 type:complete len:407 (-) comp3948_c0_seq1:101-1321(-)